MSRPRFLTLLIVAFAVGLAFQSALQSQSAAPRRRGPDELRRLSLAAEGPGLAERFRGITTNGTVETGLSAIRSTGVSTASVRKAPDAIIPGLTADPHQHAIYPLEHDQWQKWTHKKYYQ